MLKRLAIIGLLLAVIRPIPIPGQATDHGSQASNQPKNEAPNSKAPSKPSLTLVEKNCDSDQFKNDADCEAHKNKENTIAISKFPSANISIERNPKRDGYDWGAYWANVALAIAGLGGVAVGVLTVLYIKRQVYEMAYQRLLMRRSLRSMRRQADLMDQQLAEMRSGSEIAKVNADAARVTAKASALSAVAAEKSAEASLAQIKAMKERERASLGIRVLDVPEVSGPERILDGMCHLRVCAFVENFGHSKAFNVRAYGMLDIVSDPERPPRENGFLQYFPQVIDEGPLRHKLKLGGFGREFEDIASSGDAMVVPKETIQDIRDGRAFIQASGKITYKDVFGDFQITPFRFVWKSLGNDAGGKWLTRSLWLDCNPPSDEQDDPDSEPDYDLA